MELLPLVTGERLGSYVRAGGGVVDAFRLYEWNMRATASVMELTGMADVLVRNALDAPGWSLPVRSHRRFATTIGRSHRGGRTLIARRAPP